MFLFGNVVCGGFSFITGDMFLFVFFCAAFLHCACKCYVSVWRWRTFDEMLILFCIRYVSVPFMCSALDLFLFAAEG